jgi:hypothetical protein
MERKIEASLNPIAQSVGISGNIPKEDAGKPFQQPDRMQSGKEDMAERLILARPSLGMPPERKGMKI